MPQASMDLSWLQVELDDEPWAKCHRWLWQPDPGGTRLSAKAVSLYGWVLARYGGYRKGIFPSQLTLAADLGWSEITVRRAYLELKGWHGVLRQKRRLGKPAVITLYCKGQPPWEGSTGDAG